MRDGSPDRGPMNRLPQLFAGRRAMIVLVSMATTAGLCLATGLPVRATVRSPASRQGAGLRHLSSVHWTTVFEDDFSGEAGSPLGLSWRFWTGTGLGIGRFIASPSVVHLDGHGHLVVTSMKTSQRWVSGEVETTHSYMPAPGQEMLVESRIDLPAGGRGYWPAFWGLGVPALTNPKTEPMAGEDDFAETINDDPWVGQFMHCGISNPTGPAAWTPRWRPLSAPPRAKAAGTCTRGCGATAAATLTSPSISTTLSR